MCMDREITLMIIGAVISQASSITILLLKHYLDRRMTLWKEELTAIRRAKENRLDKLTGELESAEPAVLANRLAEFKGLLGELLPRIERELSWLSLLLRKSKRGENNGHCKHIDDPSRS